MYARLLLGGGGSNGNSRYDNELSSGGEPSFFKRAPPKSTLMDYMTSLKLSHETKPGSNDENEKSKDRSETKRRTEEPFHSTHKNDQDATAIHSNPNTSDQTVFQQTGIYESLDSEDDPSQSGYRERRNPLPPRFVSPALFSVCLTKRGGNVLGRKGFLILHFIKIQTRLSVDIKCQRSAGNSKFTGISASSRKSRPEFLVSQTSEVTSSSWPSDCVPFLISSSFLLLVPFD